MKADHFTCTCIMKLDRKITFVDQKSELPQMRGNYFVNFLISINFGDNSIYRKTSLYIIYHV